jgi:hypothetical protein
LALAGSRWSCIALEGSVVTSRTVIAGRVLSALGALLRDAAMWAAATSLTTSTVSAVARAACLPPYWPSGSAFRCRPEGATGALLRAVPDALITAVLLFVPALALGAGILALAHSAGRLHSMVAARIIGAAGGVALWALLVSRLERSHLDFIVSGYAIAAGAMVGAILGDRLIMGTLWKRRIDEDHA